jgi:hypothetical protein
VTITPQELLAIHDRQLRARMPELEAIGVVYERDGDLVRAHYGTHGTVDHRSLRPTDLATLIQAQQQVFAERSEPVEWKVYEHDGPALPEALLAAGFTPGWRRSLLIASVSALQGPVSPRIRSLTDKYDPELVSAAHEAARDGQPHRVTLDQLDADEQRYQDLSVLTLSTGNSIQAVGWAHRLDRTDFIEIGGLTAPQAEFLPVWAAWCRERRGGPFAWKPAEAQYVVAEAEGDQYEMLIAGGFQHITTVESYHWEPPGPRWPARPMRMLLGDPEYRALWDAVEDLLTFDPSPTEFPAIVAPSPSATWSIDGLSSSGPPAERFEAAVRRALISVTAPGELLYWLDWRHPAYEFDPRRVGRPGYPDWVGQAYPDGDHYFYLSTDLRLGTYGDHWEHTFCVFGAKLLAELETELTELLGTPIRRR